MTNAFINMSKEGTPHSLRMSLKLHKDTWGKYFSKREFNAVVRHAALVAGRHWIVNYLPLRFQGYARAVGIYTGKKRKGRPLVHTGSLEKHTLTASRAEAVAKDLKGYLDLVIPTTTIYKPKPDGMGPLNYSSNPVVKETLSRITTREIGVINRVFTEQLEGFFKGATPVSYRRGPNKGQIKSYKLTTTQRAMVGIKQRKNPAHPERK